MAEWLNFFLDNPSKLTSLRQGGVLIHVKKIFKDISINKVSSLQYIFVLLTIVILGVLIPIAQAVVDIFSKFLLEVVGGTPKTVR